MLALVSGLGCAPKAGWERTADRSCDASGPARVCLEAQPDQPIELDVGGETIVPGECVVAPAGTHGGSLRVAVRDGRGTHAKRWVSTRAGATTTLRVRASTRIEVAGKRVCDRSLP